MAVGQGARPGSGTAAGPVAGAAAGPGFGRHAPRPGGLWRRTPPAIFPPIMGLFGLGLGWRRGAAAFGMSPGPAADMVHAVAEAILGAVTLLFLFALLAYGAKVLRRPGVVAEDLRILPGRAGVAALVLSLYLLALVAVQYRPAMTGNLLIGALVAHGALVLLLLRGYARGPAEQRRVTPVWHLNYVGGIIAALAALKLGWQGCALILFAASTLIAVAIWAVSLGQLLAERVSAPLRPLLAIHLSPAALIGAVAAGLGMATVAQGFAVLSAVILAVLVLRARWLTAAGFSPLWGAFTFPLAATAGLWLTLGGRWHLPGALTLLAATVVVPWIAARILRLWAGGQLAQRTNAATA
ncbi:MAG: tellurium resistance protein [Alphaproteobacteria bacterium HGW-Alphaproteobacteria-6]|nr:MAG: tellurium resistance protein [Alphaproteobacteria bacterium HGW-Alphaproteobacteria-6]